MRRHKARVYSSCITYLHWCLPQTFHLNYSAHPHRCFHLFWLIRPIKLGLCLAHLPWELIRSPNSLYEKACKRCTSAQTDATEVESAEMISITVCKLTQIWDAALLAENTCVAELCVGRRAQFKCTICESCRSEMASSWGVGRGAETGPSRGMNTKSHIRLGFNSHTFTDGRSAQIHSRLST